MEPYQKRVVEEREQLEEKIEKLGDFIDSDRFDELEQIDRTHLLAQFVVMTMYSTVLEDRIKRFNGSGRSDADKA